ncbi:hypothetical protein C5B42_01120 [Candidatus Cerribacteria bacterium 'Amazon FNV 2010 28 9']|uniref:Glycosyltransferase RgtA/B/C/D-like domain-containing protein n=1 Tax=Candidatus Cerribacteria bacterium 'Amazon FNV 2010 28 9' TaxID=2081795 RepID=A0A317JQ11_9BACT|nr:MAG: hypothetical protein C5B42_01120 [Candidatus Cerribacteria bacterium 'Amazon FNV 2010 28 9']
MVQLKKFFNCVACLPFKTILIGLIALAFCARLYRVTNPIADWHEFRQADTASVTREYVKHGINLLVPKYQDLSNIQSGSEHNEQDNVNGYRMVEFPIMNAVIASVIRLQPEFDWQYSLVFVSRMFSIVASLVALVFLLFLARDWYGDAAAIATGIFFGFTPYVVFYSRTVLPEPFLVMGIVLAMWGCWKYVQTRHWGYLALWIVAFAYALLMKPMAVFVLPVFAILILNRFGWKSLLHIELYIGGFLSIVPLLLWRWWIQRYSIGIPVSNWLYNGNGIRLRPAWFRWLFYERLTKLVFGFVGVVPFTVGFFTAVKQKSARFALWIWGGSMLAYLVIFATGNVQHDYYQYIISPFFCLTAGVGLARLWQEAAKRRTELLRIGLVFGVVIMFFLMWQQVKGYYNVNNWDMVHAGEAADRVLPASAKVIAPYDGDTAFLFATNRIGWPIGFAIDQKIAEGAQYYVSLNYDDETNALMKKYTVIAQTKDWVIIDLTRPKK